MYPFGNDNPCPHCGSHHPFGPCYHDRLGPFDPPICWNCGRCHFGGACGLGPHPWGGPFPHIGPYPNPYPHVDPCHGIRPLDMFPHMWKM